MQSVPAVAGEMLAVVLLSVDSLMANILLVGIFGHALLSLGPDRHTRYCSTLQDCQSNSNPLIYYVLSEGASNGVSAPATRLNALEHA